MKKLITITAAACVLAAGTLLAADAKVIYDKECTKCHGADGKGDTKMGKKLGAKDYTDPKVQAAVTDAAAFKAIGLNAAELKKIDPAEALRQTAVALSKFADDGDKARRIQELFGKSLREVAPFLNDLATKGELVAKVTSEQAAEAEKFNHQLTAMQKNSADTVRALVGSMLPALNQMLEIFNKIRDSGDLGLFLAESVKRLAGAGSLTLDAGKDINALIERRTALVAKMNAEAGKGKGGVALNPFATSDKQELVEINRLLEISRIRQLAVVNAANGGDMGDAVSRRFRPKSVGGQPDKVAKDKQSEAERYLETLEKQLEKSQDLTVIEQVLTDIEKGRIQGLTPAWEEQIIAKAHLLDAAHFQADADKKAIEIEKELAAVRGKASEQLTRYLDSMARENDAIIANNSALRLALEERGLSTEALEALRLARLDATIAQEKELLINKQSAAASAEEIAIIEQRIRLKQQERDLTADTAKRRVQLVEEDENKKRTEALSKSIEDGILTGFRNGKGFADVFLEELKAQFAKTILRPLIQPVAEAGNAPISSFLKNFLSFDGGGSTGGGPRSGGLDGKGGFLGMLHPQESVIDHTKGGGGGGHTIIINQNVGDLVTASLLQRNNQALVRQIQAGLSRSQGYGGALA